MQASVTKKSDRHTVSVSGSVVDDRQMEPPYRSGFHSMRQQMIRQVQIIAEMFQLMIGESTVLCFCELTLNCTY